MTLGDSGFGWPGQPGQPGVSGQLPRMPGFGISPLNEDVMESLLRSRKRRSSGGGRRQASLLVSNIAKDQRLEQERQAAFASEAQAVEERSSRDEDRPGFLSRVGSVLNLPGKHVSKPAAGTLIAAAFGIIPGQQKGEQALRDAVFGGKSDIGSFNIFAPERAKNIRNALEKTDLPPGVLGTMEFLLDPMIVLPVGKAGSVARSILQASPKTASKVTARLGTMPKITELTDFALTPNRARQITERLNNVPIVRQALGVLNPSSLQQNQVGRQLLGYAHLLETGENLANVGAARFAGMSMPFKIQEGFVTLRSGSKAAWGDIFENPGKFSLDDAQKVFIKEMHNTLDEATAMLKANGISITELNLGEGAHWIPRIVRGKEGIDQVRTNMGYSLGARASFQKTRFYQEMEEGLTDGIDYLNDPAAVLHTTLRSAYRLIADKQLIKQIRPMGNTMGQRLNKFNPGLRELLPAARITGQHLGSLDKTITQVFQGRRLGPEISLAEKQMPEFGARLRRANEMKGSLGRGIPGTTGETQGQMLQALQRDVRIAAAKNKAEIKDLLIKVKDAKRLAATPSLSEARIFQPGLAGRIFPNDVAKDINRFFQPGATEAFWKNMAEINAAARLGATGFDFGAGMIQGIPLLATNIPGWIRAQKVAISAAINPKALERYKAANNVTFKEMAENGVPISASEMVEAAGAGGLLGRGGALTKIPVVGPVLRLGAERAAAAFNGFGDAARKEFWEALKPIATKKGTPNAMRELADSVSKLTGTLSLDKLGIMGTQKQMGRSLFFAERYYRASMGVLIDTLQGGVRGEVARTTMAKMMAGGMLMYFGVSAALGQEPKLDPRKGDFLTWEVAGNRVGIGSIWVAMARGTASVTKQAIENPTDLIPFYGQDSQLTRFARSRMSPTISFAWDVVSGRDFVGKPIDSVPQISARLLRTSTPFWAQDFMPDFADGELEDPGASPLGVAADFLGLREFPVSAFQERKDRRNFLASPGKWEDLGGLVRKHFSETDSTLKFLDGQVRAWGLERGDELDQLTGEYLNKQEEFRENYTKTIETAEREVREANGTGRNFRTKMDDAGAILRHDYQIISDDPRFAPVKAEFKRWAERNPDKDSKPVEDVAFDEYMAQVVLGGDLHDDFDNYNFEEAEARKQALRDFYGDATIDRVEERLGKANLPPMARELRQGRELFRNYWGIGDQISQQFGLVEQYAQYKKVQGGADGDAMVKQLPILKEIDSRVTKIRQQMRTISPALDAWMFKYGYTQTLRNKINLRQGKALLEEADFYTLDLPMGG